MIKKMQIKSKTTRISALLPSALVEEIEKESEGQSTTKSAIIKNALELWLNRKLDRDSKKLAKLKIDDIPSEEEWELIQPAL